MSPNVVEATLLPFQYSCLQDVLLKNLMNMFGFQHILNSDEPIINSNSKL